MQREGGRERDREREQNAKTTRSRMGKTEANAILHKPRQRKEYLSSRQIISSLQPWKIDSVFPIL
jgi:hypothetical protein